MSSPYPIKHGNYNPDIFEFFHQMQVESEKTSLSHEVFMKIIVAFHDRIGRDALFVPGHTVRKQIEADIIKGFDFITAYKVKTVFDNVESFYQAESRRILLTETSTEPVSHAPKTIADPDHLPLDGKQKRAVMLHTGSSAEIDSTYFIISQIIYSHPSEQIQKYLEAYQVYYANHNTQGVVYEGFNIHDTKFQKVALELLKNIDVRLLASPMNLLEEYNLEKSDVNIGAITRLIRARNYAVSSNPMISWSGQDNLTTEAIEAKQTEMENNWKSLEKFRWELGTQPQAASDASTAAVNISVTRQTTQQAVEELYLEQPSRPICWLNMSNSFMTGGCYQYANGSQEESTLTHTDGIVSLGNISEIDPPTQRARYRKEWRCQSGENLFHATQFVTGEQVKCHSIACSFVDLRRRDYSERRDYVDRFGRFIEPNYTNRIRRDIRGVLLTAVAKGQRCLVLGASGCGAFQHDPAVEARIWREELASFKGHFDVVRFAIYDRKNDETYLTFQHTLGTTEVTEPTSMVKRREVTEPSSMVKRFNELYNSLVPPGISLDGRQNTKMRDLFREFCAQPRNFDKPVEVYDELYTFLFTHHRDDDRHSFPHPETCQQALNTFAGMFNLAKKTFIPVPERAAKPDQRVRRRRK